MSIEFFHNKASPRQIRTCIYKQTGAPRRPPHPSPNVSSSQQGLAPLGSPFNLLRCPARRGSVCGLSPKPRPISFTAEFCNDMFRLQLLQVCPVSFESCHLRYNLHSTRQLQQKINGIRMPLHPTSGRSYP